MSDILYFYVYPFVLLMCLLGFSTFIKGAAQLYLPIALLIVISTIIVLLLRDPFAPSDSVNYSWMYEEQKAFWDVFNAYHGDYFFSFTQYLGNLLNLPVSDFLILHSITFYLITVVGFKLILKDTRMFIICLALFSLTSTFVLLYTNVMRQGLAMSLLVLSVGLFVRNRFYLGFLFSLLAIFSHFSSLLIVISVLIFRRLNLSNRTYLMLVVSLPLLSFLSYLILPSIGNFTSRMESLTNQEYNNNLVYIKVVIMYLTLLFFYWFMVSERLFNNAMLVLIFKVYFCALGLSFAFLPALLVSSRYVYYSSVFLPIIYSAFLSIKGNSLNVYVRFFIGLIASIAFGLFVYSFDSTRKQLGI